MEKATATPDPATLDDYANRLQHLSRNGTQTFSPIRPEGIRLGHRANLGSSASALGNPAQKHHGAGGGGGDPDPSNDDEDDPRRRCPRNPRDPPDDRRYREGTYDTGGTASSRSDSKIKREDIGQFNPSFDDTYGIGVVNDGKNTIFTDVHCFIERINTFLEDSETSVSAERQILSYFPSLLGGPATLWWTNEVTASRRTELR